MNKDQQGIHLFKVTVKTLLKTGMIVNCQYKFEFRTNLNFFSKSHFCTIKTKWIFQNMTEMFTQMSG